MSLIGFALMVWLPVDDDWLRLGTGWLVVLLGGMMVSPQVVRDWLALVAELVPILRPVLKNKK